MKQIISLLVLASLVGCSRDKSGDCPAGDEVPITLSAGVPAASAPGSRAVIETGDSFTAGIAGWETEGAADYSVAEKWCTAVDITANTTAQPVVLKDPQVYNADRDIQTYMKAWHPAGALENGIVLFDNSDGTVDAMLAREVVGSKNNNTGKTLSFAHKTTQLRFAVKADATLAPGTTINKITVTGAELPTGFDLNANAVRYASAAPLTVPGHSSPVEIPAVAALVGEPVMIRPMKGNTISLRIETSADTFDNVVATIDGDDDFVEGKAYTITLTFRQQAVDLTATVDDWIKGSGSVELE